MAATGPMILNSSAGLRLAIMAYVALDVDELERMNALEIL